MASTFWYKLLKVYIPALLTIISLGFSAYALSGQSKTANGLTYLFKVDLTEIDFSNIIVPWNESVIEDSYLPKLYTIGLQHFCYTRYPEDGLDYTDCDKGLFNLYDEINKKGLLYSYHKAYVDSIVLPKGTDIPEPPLAAAYAILLVGVIFLSILFVLYLLAMFIKIKDFHILGPFLLVSIIVTLAISAGISMATSKKIVNNYQKYYSVFRIGAGLGNQRFYNYIWASMIMQVVALVFSVFGNIKTAKIEKDEEVAMARQESEQNPIELSGPPAIDVGRVNRAAEINEISEDSPPNYEDIDNHKPPPPPSFSANSGINRFRENFQRPDRT